MNISKLKRALRGDVNLGTATLEALRRARVRLGRRSEYAQLAKLNRQPLRLTKEFADVPPEELVAHFRIRKSPRFFPGFAELESTTIMQRQLFPDETARMLRHADDLVEKHCWPLLGFGNRCFGFPEIDWNRDPLSGVGWPSDYHADIKLLRGDGSDARVVWELNRLAHLITLGRAYAVTHDEKFTAEFVRQIASWRRQNPVARGLNWSCAMEVALRAMNLLGALQLFLNSAEMTAEVFLQVLTILDQHGAHIRRNLEFSHIATSNHYLCDLTGLLWLGLMLPELEAARGWREFGLRELLNEMDKQVLSDGADYEASTGYHRLKLELFLYSFILCRSNELEIEEKYWKKLRGMIDYVHAYIRSDGRAPLIGDSDSGQVFPILKHAADDHSYLLSLGGTVFEESGLKIPRATVNEELLWMLGTHGVRNFQRLNESTLPKSKAFVEAGIYMLRQNDLYLLFNAGGIGVNGRGSHAHNDALSIEVSACGTAFIVDPGSYLYTADLHQRQLFRSTAYHSTVEVDETEQNSIEEAAPFIIGNDAQPRVLRWETRPEADMIEAEHCGYRRLAKPVTHLRSVRFEKQRRYWLIEDKLTGDGTHGLSFRFHFAPKLVVNVRPDGSIEVGDEINRPRLFITARAPQIQPQLESRFSSTDYGAKEPSVCVCWSVRTALPYTATFAIIPICINENERERLTSVIWNDEN